MTLRKVKAAGIFLLLTALIPGQPAFAASAATPSVVYKISMHQIYPKGEEHALTCKAGRKRCHFILPLESKSPANAVDVTIHADPDNACMIFAFGSTMLEPGNICLRNPSSHWVRLSFPREAEKPRDPRQKPAPRVHHPFVANVIVTVTPPQTGEKTSGGKKSGGKKIGERG